jgi:hypothetical protein
LAVVPEGRKRVFVPMLRDDAIGEEICDHRKSEMITICNITKLGVNLLDHLCQGNDGSWNGRRWPVVIFYQLLNTAAINAHCIFNSNQQKG